MNRRTFLKITKSFIFFPVAILGFLAPAGVSKATQTIESGLVLTVYNNFGYNNAPPLPDISGRPIVGETTVSLVQQNFDQSPPFGMYEDFIVHYEGYITSSVSGNFRLWPQADDGTKLYIDDVLVQNDWRDKGGGGAVSSPIVFEENVSKKFEMWFYENGGGAWTTLYWDVNGYWEVVPSNAFTKQVVATTTTTTTLAPYLNSPQNLLVTSVDENKVYLSWDSPESSNISVERYAIFWSCDNWESGFAISSTTTSAVVENLEPGQSCLFKVRADNDSVSVYSGWSNEVNGTTLSTTTTTTLPPDTTTTTTIFLVFPTLPPVDMEEPVEAPTSQSDTQSDEPPTSVPQYAEEQAPTTEEITAPEAAISEIDTNSVSAEELANVVSNVLEDVTSAEELGNVVNDLLDKPLSDEQFSAVIDEVFSQDLSPQELTNVLEAVFDEPISDEKFDEVISAVLEQPLSDEEFAAVVDILESDTVSEEQVAAAVDTVLEAGINEDQATELATSEKVLESIDGEQAAEIFAEITLSEITSDEAAQIVDAVQEAPEEVRESFEAELNVFDGAVDTYVPLGSSIPVGQRRVIIAIAAATAAIPVAPTRRG